MFKRQGQGKSALKLDAEEEAITADVIFDNRISNKIRPRTAVLCQPTQVMRVLKNLLENIPIV